MAEGGERLVALLVPLGEHDHEWPRAIGQPRHGDPNVGVGALVHDLHSGVPGIENDAFAEIANAQRHVGEPEVGHRLTLLGKTLDKLWAKLWEVYANPVARFGDPTWPCPPARITFRLPACVKRPASLRTRKKEKGPGPRRQVRSLPTQRRGGESLY